MFCDSVRDEANYLVLVFKAPKLTKRFRWFWSLQCWTSVHAGGRRKLHEFRALYDYYDKRMDYGDGEFPSRWPSEIEQDEKYGWGLRIYPRRKPDEVKGSWERYVDAETNREWFYNKDTEQNSYIPPEPFALERNVEWIKYYDEVQGVHYYFNTNTQESTFTRPPAYFTPRLSPASAETAVVSTQGGWERYVDPLSGSPYYYNRRTMESVFARPLGFTTVREAQDDGVEPIRTGLSDWAKYFDASTGSYYYFNSRTKESAIQRPDAFVTPRMSAKEAGMDGLAEFYDPITGKTYYFSPNTTECRQADALSSTVGNGSQ
ncbi:hypothetical protein BBJ28_00020734 [Nothophytophthora sp. Chile5]|nr:hypothetical protein BBJ28_00020734 [Nothophytophthora sp. Chile5]